VVTWTPFVGNRRDEPIDGQTTGTVAEPTQAEDGAGPGPARRRRPRLPPQPLVLLACLGLAVWLYAPAWSSPADTTVRGGAGDPAIFIFFLRWVPFALGHGQNPLVTHHLNYPDGVNLMWNSSLPLPGLLLAPVTSLWGPVLTYNLLLVLAFGLSAWCAYLAILRFVPGHLAAAAGGLVYGFSPAMRSQISHPHMSLAFLVPLMLLSLHEILVCQRRSPWLAGAALGLLAGCQLLIGEELLAMTALIGFVLFLLLLLGNLRRLRSRVAHTLKAFAAALVVFAAIAAWPLAVQFTGPQRVHGDVQKTARMSDLYSFVLPDSQQVLAPATAARRVSRLGGSAYLGIPLLLVVAAVALRRWSDALVRVGLALLVVAAVLSLGTSLQVGGRVTGVRLPMALLERLPLLDSLIPTRMAQLTALFAGLLLALFLHPVWGRGGSRRVAAAAVGLAVLAPLWPAQPVRAETVATPAFFTGAAVRELPRDGVALVLPFPYGSSEAMTWQAEAGIWFRMPGGYFIGPQPNGQPRFYAAPTPASTAFTRIRVGRPPPKLTGTVRQALADDFVRWRVGSVVVGPMPNRAVMVEFLTELLGTNPERVDGVDLWRDPVVRLRGPGPPGARPSGVVPPVAKPAADPDTMPRQLASL
jgi:hypothetical protein